MTGLPNGCCHPPEKAALADRLAPAIRQELELAAWEADGARPDPTLTDALVLRLAHRVAVVLTRDVPLDGAQ